MRKQTVLVVAAHPDDEILGCGGTIAKLSSDYDVYSLVLGEGVTARDTQRDAAGRRQELVALQQQMKTANRLLGVKELFFHEFPDNRFDSVDLIDITKTIESLIEKLHPTIVYTHFGNDLNIDHQMTNAAVLTATRPLPGQVVREVYAFEISSSTEFNFPLSFTPDTFSDISAHIETKISALDQYESEMRPFPHPRSTQMIRNIAEYWGVRVGVQAAESFKTLRKVW